MSVILELIEKNDINPGQIERIRVGTNHHMPTTLLHNNPNNELEAKFSMPFSAAILALRRRAGLSEYTDEVVRAPETVAMMKRVDFYVNEEANAAGFHKMTSIIDILLNDGRRISGRAEFGKGSPANPMSWDEVAAKFYGCASYAGLPSERAREVVSIVADLPSLKSVRTLTAILSI
jgi:2-methylcitrate dehydratase PrpD